MVVLGILFSQCSSAWALNCCELDDELILLAGFTDFTRMVWVCRFVRSIGDEPQLAIYKNKLRKTV